ncbi:MAG: penicillin-binding protein 2 [Neisseria sp.]
MNKPDSDNFYIIDDHQQHNREQDFRVRLLVAFVLVAVLFAVLLARFVYLQVYKHADYTAQAASNRIALIPTPPARGNITDVNGVVLAGNYSAYALEVIPDKIGGEIEALISALRQYINISPTDIKRFKKFQNELRSYDRIPLKVKLNHEEAARLAPQLYRFSGVEINTRTFRQYPYGAMGAHFLGYIGRISDKDQQKLREEDLMALYRGSINIGKSGLEAYYERQLLGIPGHQRVEKDAYGKIVRVLSEVSPIAGQNLKLAMDIRVQQYADNLLGNRRGAIIAIDPQTGGVLAYVSKPTFDPNLFVDGIDHENWAALNENWQRPLINRITQGLYPPGSTFKPFMGMAALESGKLTQSTVMPAPGAWSIPGSRHVFRDSVRSGHGSANLSKAIQVSSDTFFYRLGYEMGIVKTQPYLAEFGLGSQTGIDLPHEYKGVLPSPEWKAKRFAKATNKSARQWLPGEMVSVSIGQGYNIYTPLQMAHATASLANNGVVYRPHLVKEIIDLNQRQIIKLDTSPTRTIPFKHENFEYVKQAMAKVMRPGGTAWRAGAGLAYPMGGKTGTAQVVQIKQGQSYNSASLAEQHRDHAWFISFAPLKKPKIAIAVLLENGGWGANAAPLARQLSDYYLLTLNAAGIAPADDSAANSLPASDVAPSNESITTPPLSRFQAAYKSAHQASGAANE